MINSKQLFKGLLATIFLFASVHANADLILMPAGADYKGTGAGGVCPSEPTTCDGPGVSHILAWLDLYGIGFDSSNLLYKQDLDPAEEDGSFASSYTSNLGDNGGTIIWDIGFSSISDPDWFFVKDGAHDPVWYLFDISGWNGTDTISLSGFWTGNGGAISHVAIYGSIPEPGTLALLGLGLLGMGLRRRKVKA